MGLLDLFKRKPTSRFPLEGRSMFDREKGRALAELVKVPVEARGEDWKERFFDLAWTAAVRQPDNDAFEGTDGFFYIRLDIGSPGLDPQCMANLAEGCLANGLGIAFYADADDPMDQPEFAVSFGILESIIQYDSFEGDPIDVEGAAEPLPDGSTVVEEVGRRQTIAIDVSDGMLVGAPRPDFLPPHTARAMGSYLEHVWGLHEPRVLFVADPKMRPQRGLMIGRKPSEFAPDDPGHEMLDALLWFLPPRRPVMFMPEEMNLEEMVPLRALAGLEEGEDWWA